MNEIQRIQQLDARIPEPPPIDVSAQVLRAIRQRQSAATEPAPMWLAALLSTLAAAAVLLITLQSVSGVQDPFNDLLTPVWTAFQ
jgi:hypothetical protein